MLTAEAAWEYTESLGQIGEGWWRQLSWGVRQGMPAALGMTTQQWAYRCIGSHARVTLAELPEAARELTSDGHSQREAAAILGVNQSQVSRALGSRDEPPPPEPPADQASDAIASPPAPEPPADLAVSQASDAIASPPAVPAKPRVTLNTGDNEWYTPEEYIRAAVAVMGAIDLDPASSEEANAVVGAARICTEADDGLVQPWAGRVWMNPPYAQPLIDRFCTRLAREYRDGAVTEACALVNNGTETAWFQALLEQAAALCFPRARIKFRHPVKTSAAPTQGQLVLYLGGNVAAFRAAFLRFGPVFPR